VKRSVPGLKAIRATPSEGHVATGFEQRLQLPAVGSDRPGVDPVLFRVRQRARIFVCSPRPQLQAFELFPRNGTADRVVTFKITQIQGSEVAQNIGCRGHGSSWWCTGQYGLPLVSIAGVTRTT
jgi:hypothetical protein